MTVNIFTFEISLRDSILGRVLVGEVGDRQIRGVRPDLSTIIGLLDESPVIHAKLCA